MVDVGPQVGFIFPVGGMQGYLNFKSYKEFAAENRPDGWNAWATHLTCCTHAKRNAAADDPEIVEPFVFITASPLMSARGASAEG